MFKSEIKNKFKNIFKVEKVTFDLPGESHEQNCLFIGIDSARTRFRDGEELSKVSGTIKMYAPNDKLNFGFFSKQIQKAAQNITHNLFFYEFEQNMSIYQNIVEVSAKFIYFYSGQYDPNLGSITSIEFEELT